MNLDSLTNAAKSSQSGVENLTTTVDTNDMAGMLQLQQEMGKMSMLFGTLSAVISSLKQTGQSIVQKMA
ncbi:MAG: hypothetical protein QG599_2788 [Pseudomonadota bacterium]|nr:hypothetical protein [Pseudomonadota bacterium]